VGVEFCVHHLDLLVGAPDRQAHEPELSGLRSRRWTGFLFFNLVFNALPGGTTSCTYARQLAGSRSTMPTEKELGADVAMCPVFG
jgi:hypothetical protein